MGLNDIKLVEKRVHDTYRCTCAQACKNNSNLINVGKCNVQHVTYNSFIDLWTIVICMEPKTFAWHNRTYVMGKCKLCGIETLNMCLEELISKKLVKWTNIGYDVVGHTLMAKRKKLQRFYTMKLLLES